MQSHLDLLKKISHMPPDSLFQKQSATGLRVKKTPLSKC